MWTNPSSRTILSSSLGDTNCGNLTCLAARDDNLPRRGSSLTHSRNFTSETVLTLAVLGYDVGEGDFSVLLQLLPSSSNTPSPSITGTISVTSSFSPSGSSTDSHSPSPSTSGSVSLSVTASLTIGGSPSSTNSDSRTPSPVVPLLLPFQSLSRHRSLPV